MQLNGAYPMGPKSTGIETPHSRTYYFVRALLSTFFSFQEFVTRMDAVKTTQTALLTEVQEQSAKFGDDVKYLVSTVVIRQLRPEFKFHAKFEIAFSQILGVR